MTSLHVLESKMWVYMITYRVI